MKQLFHRGLFFDFGAPVLPATDAPAADRLITPEAAIGPGFGPDFRVDPVAALDSHVAQGAPLLRSRRDPRLVVTAPMAGRVARIDLGPGRSLAQVEIFHEDSGERQHFETTGADDPATIRDLLLESGLWTALRLRPGGGFPSPDHVPAVIFIAAADSRPGAPPPRLALAGQEEPFRRGIDALLHLTPGAVHIIHDPGFDLVRPGDRLRLHLAGQLHPGGLPGGHILNHAPASPDRPVWQIGAQDVAALGTLLETGLLPETRLISVTGPGLRQPRLVHSQPGADLRALTQGLLLPGQQRLLSGDALSGVEARNLRLNDLQVTVLPRADAPRRAHWFGAALGRAARPLPLVPSAAVEQAMPPGAPAIPLLRALASGDDETAIRLGALSLLPEDLAAVDYVTAAQPRFAALLRGLLDRIAAETENDA